MLARRSCCEQVTITSQEVHGIDREAFPAYKDRLIEYLERFIGDLVVAQGRIATLLVRPGCWRWPPIGTWPTGWFVAPADDRACTSPPCMSVAVRIARTSRFIDRPWSVERPLRRRCASSSRLRTVMVAAIDPQDRE